jgi:hypothetical protein
MKEETKTLKLRYEEHDDGFYFEITGDGDPEYVWDGPFHTKVKAEEMALQAMDDVIEIYEMKPRHLR